MAMLRYSAIASLDGYTVDASGSFDWAAPDEEVHAFVNDLERSVGTYLYGRRMYETMRVWQTFGDSGEPAVIQDYAGIWRAADKVVYSSTLDGVSTPRTRLERSFDADAVANLKASAERDISIGGAGLASAAIRAGLVDEWQLLISPVIVGGGTHWLPDGVRVDLELVGERRFGQGASYLRYRTV